MRHIINHLSPNEHIVLSTAPYKVGSSVCWLLICERSRLPLSIATSCSVSVTSLTQHATSTRRLKHQPPCARLLSCKITTIDVGRVRVCYRSILCRSALRQSSIHSAWLSYCLDAAGSTVACMLHSGSEVTAVRCTRAHPRKVP